MNLICGINPVLEALSAGTRHFDRLLVVKGLRNRRVTEAITRAGQLGIALRFEARETLDRMAAGVPHQGLIAVVSAKPLITVDTLLEQAREPALLVVLDGVEDPRNLGAILRTVEAAGATGVLLPDRHSAGLSETVSRASAGALEHVRVATIGNVVHALEDLKKRGYWIVGFDATGTERWDAIDYGRNIALVLGGEGRGIRRLVREHCDHLVSIPLFGHVTSLNVSVAAGVALYEVVRQRGVVPSHVRPIPARPAAPAQIVGPSDDDGEHDPGAPPGARHALSDEEDEQDHAPAFVEEDDHPAWSGPQVLRPVVRERSEGRGRGRGRKPHGPPRRPGPPEQGRGPSEQGRGPSESEPREPAQAGGGGGPAVRDGAPRPDGAGDPHRRRRRRRDGRPRSGPGPHRGAPSSSGPPPARQGPPPEPGTGDATGGGGGAAQREGGPPGGRGRRRRRRPRRP